MKKAVYLSKGEEIAVPKGSFLNNLYDYLGVRPFVAHLQIKKCTNYFGVRLKESLLPIFGTQGRIGDDSNRQKNQSSNNIKSLQPIKIHSLAPFNKNKLTDTQPNINTTPNNKINELALSTPVNKGAIAEAKTTNPKLEVNSDNRPSWELLSNPSIGFYDNKKASYVKLIKIASVEYLGLTRSDFVLDYHHRRRHQPDLL